MRSSAAPKRIWTSGDRGGGPSRLRYLVLGTIAAALLLVSAAPAAAAEFPLIVEVEPVGSAEVECEVEGVTEPCEAEYEEGTEIVLVAEAEPGYQINGWFGCDAEPSLTECEVTMDEEREVSVELELEEVELWIFEFGSGTVECEVEGGSAEPCEAEYPYGTEITLVPKAEFNYEFVEWEDDCSGSGACELTMDGEKTVSAVFEPIEYLLEVEVEGGSGTIKSAFPGIDCGSECEAEYEAGETVYLTVEPDEGSEFVDWEGCDGKTGTECEVTMDEDRSVIAILELKEFALELETAGEGEGEIECEVEGEAAEECESEYPYGTKLALVANADPGSEFVEWEGDCTGSGACELTIDEEKEVTAVFELEPPEYALEVELEGEGEGTVTSSPEGIDCGSECQAEFPEGTTVTLTASASLGSEFAGWENCDAEPSATKCEVTMDEARGVIATFELAPPPTEFALTVSLAGTGSGTVTSSPGSINCGVACSDVYDDGTEVTLTATPASGSTFSGWSGACAGTGSCVVTMDESRSVTATFEKEATPPTPGIAKVASKAKVKGGKALLRVTCRGETRCKGTIKLFAKVKIGKRAKNKLIGKAGFGIAAGKKKTIKVKLSGPAKRELAKRQLKAKVKGSGVRRSTVKLKK